ncbi:hypothetical protein FEM48_Zijuj03G0019900 [Ziziphus jujuba var. spinosa]|uniref:Uncharacterized protein n=1 Tax=Ziziphus jujuba var. spinosa TaxID=714518 RepID=A0A978VMH7_ZIZJJ|nr:hypothetical protein FEM48_Zijuj03G0019900 [Ziziphus jujuba var. spinosa]
MMMSLYSLNYRKYLSHVFAQSSENLCGNTYTKISFVKKVGSVHCKKVKVLQVSFGREVKFYGLPNLMHLMKEEEESCQNIVDINSIIAEHWRNHTGPALQELFTEEASNIDSTIVGLSGKSSLLPHPRSGAQLALSFSRYATLHFSDFRFHF